MSGCHVPYLPCKVCEGLGLIKVAWIKDKIKCPVCLGKKEIEHRETKIVEVK